MSENLAQQDRSLTVRVDTGSVSIEYDIVGSVSSQDVIEALKELQIIVSSQTWRTLARSAGSGSEAERRIETLKEGLNNADNADTSTESNEPVFNSLLYRINERSGKEEYRAKGATTSEYGVYIDRKIVDEYKAKAGIENIEIGTEVQHTPISGVIEISEAGWKKLVKVS